MRSPAHFSHQISFFAQKTIWICVSVITNYISLFRLSFTARTIGLFPPISHIYRADGRCIHHLRYFLRSVSGTISDLALLYYSLLRTSHRLSFQLSIKAVHQTPFTTAALFQYWKGTNYSKLD